MIHQEVPCSKSRGPTQWNSQRDESRNAQKHDCRQPSGRSGKERLAHRASLLDGRGFYVSVNKFSRNGFIDFIDGSGLASFIFSA